MDELKLIACIKQHEVLYNHSSKNFYNSALKEDAWKKVAAQLDTTEDNCKKRWNSLKASYVRAKIRKTKKSRKKKPWAFESQMEFMKSHVRTKKFDFMLSSKNGDLSNDDNRKSDKSSNENNNSNNKRSSEVLEEKENIAKRNENNLTPDSSLTSTVPTISSISHSEITVSNPQVVESVSLAGNYANIIQTPIRDTLVKYFENVVETVRDFPLALQIKVKWEISKIIHQAEMENIQQNGMQTYVRADNNLSHSNIFSNHTMQMEFSSGECTPTKFE